MRLASRFDQHIRSLGGDTYADVKKLSLYCHRTEKDVVKELKKMMRKGWFLQGHFDDGEKCFMVTNEVLNTILSRKGVKQYKSNPVPRELLEAIVAAGIAAPNAFNRQAWHFSVITNKTLLEEIDAETNHRLGDEEGYHSLYGAPVLIVISSARDNNFAKQDCSAANENMALAAKSLGLASRYLDVPNLYTNTPEGAGCKEMCGIPKDYDTVCFLCLGYSDDISEQPTPKRGDVVNYVD